MISDYSRIPKFVLGYKPLWKRIQDIKGLLRYMPILSYPKSDLKIIRCPSSSVKKTVRFQKNASSLSMLSAFSKGFVSSVNAIAIAENVLLFAFHLLLASAILIALLNFARGLIYPL